MRRAKILFMNGQIAYAEGGKEFLSAIQTAAEKNADWIISDDGAIRLSQISYVSLEPEKQEQAKGE